MSAILGTTMLAALKHGRNSLGVDCPSPHGPSPVGRERVPQAGEGGDAGIKGEVLSVLARLPSPH